MQIDKDLRSIQEVRDLLKQAKQAAFNMLDFDQAKVDKIVASISKSIQQNAEKLAKSAVDETGFGNYQDKIIKNQFASKNVYEYIKDLKTVGIINRDNKNKTFNVAVPMGVVAGIIPSTNPTSTAIYKTLISVKARNAIVMSPHPAAQKCIMETVEIMRKAAENAGAPKGLISCMTQPTLEGTSALFKSEDTAIILATGGSAMVKAAYASGRPALGVGPGNVPAFIEKSADVGQAVNDIVAGKSFDYGVICASEQAAVVDRSVSEKARKEFVRHGGYFCSPEEKIKLEKLMVGYDYHVNPKIVGLAAPEIARRAGFQVPENTTVLIVNMDKVGREDPLSFEKLSPVLCYYDVANWLEGCERSIEILNYGGLGHTMAIHSKDNAIIEEFALFKPAFRIVVNSPATHGAIGYSTNLPAALTLGPGAMGGSSTSDNISPLHLINIKHVAYGIREVKSPLMQNARSRVDNSSTSTPRSTSADMMKDIENRVMDVLQKRNDNSNNTGKTNLSDSEIEEIINEVRNSK